MPRAIKLLKMEIFPLPREFYLPSAEIVAPALLGHFLVRQTENGLVGGPIVETEAYLVGDPACHAYKNQTLRNASMWGAPGFAYVYQIYGAYFCFNAVCQPAGKAEAVLVRAIEAEIGIEAMEANRIVKKPRDLTNGPSKLCVAMKINRQLDGADICDANSPLFIARNPEIEEFLTSRGPVIQTTRIGLTRAADWEMRWYLDGSEFVSRRTKINRR